MGPGLSYEWKEIGPKLRCNLDNGTKLVITMRVVVLVSVLTMFVVVACDSDHRERFETFEEAQRSMKSWNATPYFVQDSAEAICGSVDDAQYENSPGGDARWLALAAEYFLRSCDAYQSALLKVDWSAFEAAKQKAIPGAGASEETSYLNAIWDAQTYSAQAYEAKACGFLRDFDVAAQDGFNIILC